MVIKPFQHLQFVRLHRNPAVCIIIGATVLLAGLCAFYSYHAIRYFTLKNVKQSALLEVQQGVDDIDKWLAILRDRVETLAHTPNIQTLEWSFVEPYLHLELARQENFFKFTLIDAQGYRIGNTSVGLKRDNISDRNYFQRAIAGQTNPSDAIVSRSTGIVQINIATPIWPVPEFASGEEVQKSPGHQTTQGAVFVNAPIGVFAGSVKVDRLADVIQQLRYGKDSYAFALNSAGQAMVHPDPALVSTWENPAPSLLQSNQTDLAAVAQQMVQNQKGIELVSLDGRMWYIAYLPLEEADWSIGLVIPQTTIERQLRPLNLIACTVVALTGLLLFVLWRVHVVEQNQLKKSKADADEIAKAASAANRAKSEFLSHISHELRTPLHGILGYAQILKRHQNLSHQQIKGLNIIYQSGHHLLMLINDILDLAKIEARKLELVPTLVNLPDLLSTVTAILQMRASEKGLCVVCHADPALPTQIKVDEKRLRQILLNLLGNAVKFTDTGSVTLWVRLLAQESTNVTLQFEISDTGIGIQPQHLTSIFQPFEQVRERQHRWEGTGLGLAVTRQLVEKMGGILQVESEWRKGSRFWFDVTFPVIAADAAKAKTLSVSNFGTCCTALTNPVQLTPPPLETLKILYELAQFGNMQKLWDYADHLEKLDPNYSHFSHQIKDFSDQFEDEKILNLIKRYLPISLLSSPRHKV